MLGVWPGRDFAVIASGGAESLVRVFAINTTAG